MPLLSDLPIQSLKGVGTQRTRLFEKIGAPSVGALLRLYPRDYQDWSQPLPIAQAPLDTVCVVRATVARKPSQVRIPGGRLMCRCTVTDGESDLHLTFFNNKYIPSLLEEGRTYLFRGKISARGGRAMISPEFSGEEKASAIVPVYPATQGLTSRMISHAVGNALSLLPDPLDDPLPLPLRECYSLCHLGYALENIHFPRSMEDLEIARRRLIFEEFLVLQLGLMQIKDGRQEPNLHPIPNRYPEDFAALLPFRLTGAQQRAIAQGVADMAGKSPMNRLIQGDVGSGKTAVAAALCWPVIQSGCQAALMAPTEILAAQHYQSLSALLEPAGVRCALFTGSIPAAERRKQAEALARGETGLAIGTHALIGEKIAFHNLGLVITDEQHRFGVNQRVALAQKGASPHLLVMSATPIPRTLALMAYGDLDVSVLDELPPGRRQVETYLIGPDKRERAFRYVQKYLDEGRQGYLICPLVEEGETGGVMDVETYATLVRKAFPGTVVDVLHGKMKPAQKERVMENFAEGRTQLLVATTVVEVGVDVPNAAIMLIENAERYGLSQLHQLRGRIGRGAWQSTGILVAGSDSPGSLERLRLFKSTNDGFAIADADLKLRGPGDFFGQRQHGLPQLKLAGSAMNLDLLQEAQKCARRLIRAGELEKEEYRLLREEIRLLFSRTGSDRVAL
ncbi:ATP-dependent DNA helicase RecG [Acutalibacter sp. 1XD8-33]|uniref:ATP-dependent DNA helicase RecG n=1 Tax=Acutalibacter sp. 1XD8-33 TaxID=2320081 RepID=UPI000EA1A58F|nr:ATP-dependent DNA helicase RecG [Acutalibacter sp. 1XD8-33]RKJ41232.1 ATP-dependent DNA helicase RecG [Acutalibacter sp. 1XD8-33]